MHDLNYWIQHELATTALAITMGISCGILAYEIGLKNIARLIKSLFK
jgi:hypothetical protein